MKVTFKQDENGFQIEVEHPSPIAPSKYMPDPPRQVERFRCTKVGNHWIVGQMNGVVPIFVTRNLGKVGAFFFGKFNVWPYWEFKPERVRYRYATD